MSMHLTKIFSHASSLASAALLLVHVTGAAAADGRADIHQQVKELLAGTTATHSAPRSDTPGMVARPTIDAQEFARQLLLGTSGHRVNEATKQSENSTASRESSHEPTQTSVQRMLLGELSAGKGS
jgi:hypothetical protein